MCYENIIGLHYVKKISEHGYFKNEGNLSEDTNIQEDMIDAVVEVLEEKGVMSGQDIDTKMKKKLHSKQKPYKV